MEFRLSDERYEELWLEWQYALAEILKYRLEAKQIKSEIAHDVVGTVLFDLAMIHDQHGIKLNGETFTPRIGFLDKAGVLVTSDEQSFMHEAAFGNADEAFGN